LKTGLVTFINWFDSVTVIGHLWPVFEEKCIFI
jgi:hypothetical protein